MSVINKLAEDVLVYLKAKDFNKVAALRTVLAEIIAVGKNNGNRETIDSEAFKVLQKFVSNINETIINLEKLSNNRFADKISMLKDEKLLYEKYLPTKLTETELTNIIKTLIETNLTKSMGPIMSALKAGYAGRYDSKNASEIVKRILESKK